MAAGTAPIFVATPRNSYIATGIASNPALDGTGANQALVFTAGANGSKIEQISVYHMGTNLASVVRFFINNGSSLAVASNNALVSEVTLAANTLSQVAASVPIVIYPNIIMPANYKLYVTIGTTVASGYMVDASGGDY